MAPLKGNTAREMASAPLRSTVDSNATPVAGNDIATALTEALKTEAIEQITAGIAPAALLEAALESNNPISAHFKGFSFRAPDRDMVYPDPRNPNTTNRTVAFVMLPQGKTGLVLEARIYRRDEMIKDAAGTQEKQTFSFTLPKPCKPGDKDLAVGTHLAAFADEVLDAFETWEATITASTIVAAPRRSARVRLVKHAAA